MIVLINIPQVWKIRKRTVLGSLGYNINGIIIDTALCLIKLKSPLGSLFCRV